MISSVDLYDLVEDWGYDGSEDRQRKPADGRVATVTARNFTGRERISRESRYSRRPAPQRLSGTHRRGNKRYGI